VEEVGSAKGEKLIASAPPFQSIWREMEDQTPDGSLRSPADPEMIS
jgi:hypothetical protein